MADALDGQRAKAVFIHGDPRFSQCNLCHDTPSCSRSRARLFSLSIPDFSAGARVTARSVAGHSGQIQEKGAAHAGGAVHLHIAPLALGNLPRQIKPYTHALSLPRAGTPVKPAENFGLFRLGNARPRVPHTDGGKQLITAHRHSHRAAGRRVFHRIVQQITDGFLGPLGVKDSVSRRLRHRQRDPLLPCPGSVLAAARSTMGARSPAMGVQRQNARLQP